MTQAASLSMNLHFAPALEVPWIMALALCGLVLILVSFYLYRRAIILRALTFAAFMLALLNPSIVKEERHFVNDVVTIVVDESASQNMGDRTQRTQTALESLTHQINALGDFELRLVRAPQKTLTSRTDLFDRLDQSLRDIPQKRRAGVIFLTDGQVHDIPKDAARLQNYGPVHLLLSGAKNEKDRRITITQAPAYGVVGEAVRLQYRVKDTDNIKQPYAAVTLTLHDGAQQFFNVPVNQEQSLTLTLDHPSHNIFSLSVAPVKDEITQANNRTALMINGVRNRLKVLLVSGIPHTGERTWRDLLTSDPGVDLVHFTILREPQKLDYTPQNELSLIAFPFRELFEVKLYDFDLIIFDRYRVNNILPHHYFKNIARYVREGGAFLEASGPAFAGESSLYQTALGDILPGRPTGTVFSQRFKPARTALGRQHPVTQSLLWQNKEDHWGAWLRAVDIQAMRGDALMHSGNNSPLLLLDRVGKGRVAQIASDHIWLWAKGYDGGGPHTALLRRIVHWLMKEPALDEHALDVTIHKDNITLRKQNYTKALEEPVTLTLPDGTQKTLDLSATGTGILEHKFRADQLGVYAFEDINGARQFAIMGDLNPPELSGVITTDKHFAPLIQAARGTTIWLENTPAPKVSTAPQNARRFGGSNWLALKRNHDYTVGTVKNIPLLPTWMVLFLLLSVLIILWWREGQSR